VRAMRRLRTLALSGVTIVVILGLSGCLDLESLRESEEATIAPSSVVSARVVRVVDGDTIHALVGGTTEKVRLIGMDTPETTREHEPLGPEATAYTTEALLGRKVWLETDAELRDRYGRLLAYVWLREPGADDEAAERDMHNARIVSDGYAQIYTFPPNVKHAELLLRLQREARAARRGLWAAPSTADPLTGRRAEEVP